MFGKRSRQGCDECRKRRRKCDETKPVCGHCASFRRTCNYTLRVVWGGRLLDEEAPPYSFAATAAERKNKRRSSHHANSGSSGSGSRPATAPAPAPAKAGPSQPPSQASQASQALALVPAPIAVPACLPNGVPLSPTYQRLLDYFIRDILASLSVHPSIHQDLCQGLVPTMLHSPHLLSAGLALSAAGLVSRGLSDVAGVSIKRVIEHLQSSGLALLRQALAIQQEMQNGVLMATCLLWCLADVFVDGGRSGSHPNMTAILSMSGTESDSDTHTSSRSPALADSLSSSWRIHLQGVKALLGGDRAFDAFVTSAGSSRSAMRHLYLLYLSLQTLPYVPPRGGAALYRSAAVDAVVTADSTTLELPPPLPLPSDSGDITTFTRPKTAEAIPCAMAAIDIPTAANAGGLVDTPRIDGFLGYSEEMLEILQAIDQIANMPPHDEPIPADSLNRNAAGTGMLLTPHLSGEARAAANALLGKTQQLIRRDAATELPVMIAAPELSAASGREFVLCHRCFQQATLIHVYRRLFRLPSGATQIQDAVAQIHHMAGQMTQGAPCHTWVAMSMPIFTVGCEAFMPSQQAWAHASLDTLAASIGSMHVRVVRQALEDVWHLRARRGDTDGRLCAAHLLDELNYNIILF